MNIFLFKKNKFVKSELRAVKDLSNPVKKLNSPKYLPFYEIYYIYINYNKFHFKDEINVLTWLLYLLKI